MDPKKGFFDLGDIATLVDPSLVKTEEVSCPEVDFDLTYRLLIFTIMMIFQLVFVLKIMPETKGRSLEELGNELITEIKIPKPMETDKVTI